MAKKKKNFLDTEVIYCGDNLEKLQELPAACADLIYIDPPFNSNRDYEVFWGETKEKRAFEDRHESTKAYIDFMRPRCVELARVLKPTGSFYYHCDWHASHYVKVMLDQIMGENSFVNEIIWKRSANRSSMSKIFRRAHDVLLFYSGSSKYTFNMQYKPLSEGSLAHFQYEDERGRYQLVPLLVSGKRNGETGKPWKGVDPNTCGKSGMHWVTVPVNLDAYDARGLVYWPERGDRPRLKDYLETNKGVPLSDIWDDIDLINAVGSESLGYPTQKPIALLDRIIKTSSNEGDVVLDAFCGCGTALASAQLLDRRWIGIDVSPTACRVMAKRLWEVCRQLEGKDFFVRDLPRSEKQLRDMPPFEFENWAVIALGGIPNKAQVGDMGIDGKIFPVSAVPTGGKSAGEFDFMDVWYPIQVKQKDKAGRPDIDAFEAVMHRENRTKGFFVSFAFTDDAMKEINSFFRKSGKAIIPLTVADILNEELAMKLA